jgi:hypothetical protein
MSEIAIDFEWYRDPKGYDLLPAEPRDPTKSLLAGAGRPRRIARRGGDLVAYRPLDKHHDLYRRLANVESAEDLTAFIGLYGPLSVQGLEPERGEWVEDGLAAAQLMRRVLLASDDQGEMARVFSTGASLVDLARIDYSLVYDPKSKRLKNRLTVRNLGAAIWVQLGHKLAAGAVVRKCLQCKDYFEAGLGSRPARRHDAVFCSTDCRVTYNSLARTRS